MRERLIDSLGDLPHQRALVYLMGPYEAFDVTGVLEAAEADDQSEASTVPENVDFGRLVGADAELDQVEATLDLLVDVRDQLRTNPGVNAFLAIDVDIPLEEMDAATQSIRFALASNAVVYVVPQVGDNLGVGIEVGAVLEAIFQRSEGATPTNGTVRADHHERIVFVHEAGVRSAMIAAVQDRWNARIYSYEDRSDLVRQIRLFVRDVLRRERDEDLPRLD